MQNIDFPASSSNLELARTCVALIRDIAGRAVSSGNPEHIGYALQELTQVLLERTGTEERIFEPVPADRLHNLQRLHTDLDFVDSMLQDMIAASRLEPLGGGSGIRS